jgi:hypothetical protein
MNVCVASDAVNKDIQPLTVAQKLDIIKRLDRGERFMYTCCFQLLSSNVRTFLSERTKLNNLVDFHFLALISWYNKLILTQLIVFLFH